MPAQPMPMPAHLTLQHKTCPKRWLCSHDSASTKLDSLNSMHGTARHPDLWLKVVVWPLQFFEDHCLLEQRFVLDDALRVREVLASTSKQLGALVSISGVSRLQCGEGLDQGGQASVADQVADTVQQAAQAG